MYSRYLSNIDAAISCAPDELSADCLRAKRAAYLVRQGNEEEVAAIINRLHVRYDSRPNAEISSWVNFVEGLRGIFCGLEGIAFDKMLRAHALAAAANISSMRSLSAGWIANLRFGLLDVRGMGERLDEAFEFADQFDHQALSRAGLVCAVALHFANRYDLAKPWYKAARAHAAEEADDATVSAVMHNIACIGVANLRQATLTGIPTTQIEPNALLEAESTSSYDSLVGTTSVSAWVPILMAQARCLYRDFEEALRIYSKYMELAPNQGLGRVMCYMLSDMAWCQLQIGDSSQAESTAAEAESSIQATTLIDDRAATHSRLYEVYKSLGKAELASKHNALAIVHWSEFRRLQSTFVARVERMSPR